MALLRLVACTVAVTVVLGLGSAVGAAEKADIPTRLVEVKSQDLMLHASAFRSAEEQGHLKLAGRAEDLGFVYIGPEASRTLRAQGIEYTLLHEDVRGSEIYLVGKADGTLRASIEASANILSEGESYYLVRVEPEAAFAVHALPFKKRLPFPTEAGLPLGTETAQVVRPSPRPLAYNPVIQAMVDEVSSSNLYSWLSGLTGENPVTIGGETYTINTRYSPNVMCRRAGQFLKEQFEAMGLEAEYDYFNFRTVMKAVIFPFDNLEGWAVGKRTTVIHTQDGGNLWIEDNWSDEGGLNDIAMWSRTHGCIVGNGGIIKVTDDGRTWQTVSSPTSDNLKAVVFIDSLTVLCCGDEGTILRSDDGGDSWSTVSTPTSRDLNGMCFASSDEGWAVGASGRIIRSLDTGSSWSIVTSPVSVDLHEVTFEGTENGWISGSSGRILRTEDGQTWQEMSTPVSADLQSVFFISETLGWACGLEGVIIKSTDGGSSWSDLSLDVLSDLTDIFFASPSEGWVVGNGVIRRSLDGGLEWPSKHDAVESGDVNVVATMPGTVRPEEIYIICGHYDSRSEIPDTYAPGADDNGTGTVSTLEAARVLKDYDFECTLRFVCFSREEQGLVGSGQYVKQAYEQGDSIIAALNFDMIGYEDSHPEDVDILYNTFSDWLADEYETAAALYVPSLDVVKGLRSYVGSDNSSFWDYGYPAFCGIEDSPLNNPQYHRTTDRISTIDFDFYTDVVKGGVATLAELAMLDTVTSSVTRAFEPGWFRVSPNPGRGEIAIEMSVRGERMEGFEIYDVTGRLVCRVEPAITDGVARAVWRGENASGDPVGPGIYYLRLAGHRHSTKIVLLR